MPLVKKVEEKETKDYFTAFIFSVVFGSAIAMGVVALLLKLFA